MRYKLLPNYSYEDDDINDYIDFIAEDTINWNKIKRISTTTYKIHGRHKYITTTTPIDNTRQNLNLWQDVFEQVLNEAKTKHQTIIICPCKIDCNYWFAIVIIINKKEHQIKTSIRIYDSIHDQEALDKVTALIAILIPYLNSTEIKDSSVVIKSKQEYAPHESGVIVAEYIAQFFIDYPITREINENIEQLRAKHITQITAHILRDREWHYGKTNFLSRNTTLTRSIVLNNFLEKCELLRPEPDYSDTAFILTQHLIPQTIELIKALTFHFKAQYKNIFLLGKLYSTEPWTLHQLQKLPINLIETITEDYKEYSSFADKFLADILRLMIKVQREVCTEAPRIKKIIILDDGGRLITQFMTDSIDSSSVTSAATSTSSISSTNVFSNIASTSTPELYKLQQVCQKILQYCNNNKIKIAAVEQTSAGCDSESKTLVDTSSGCKVLPFPIVMMASSAVKKLLEPVLISGQLWDKLQNVIFNHTLANHPVDITQPIRIGIIGYGKIGQAVARKINAYNRLKKSPNIELFIYDTDPNIKTPSTIHCQIIKELPDFVNKSHYIIGCTGRDTFDDIFANEVLRSETIEQIKESKIFISNSSENKEFFALIQWLKQRKLIFTTPENPLNEDPLAEINAKIGNYEIKILYGGYPFNFSGYSPAVYFQDIQSTLCMLFGGILHAYYLTQDDLAIMANNGRGIANLFVYDPFIQQTIIKLSIENIESLVKIFNSPQLNTTEDLKFLKDSLESLAANEMAIVTQSMYNYSQENMYSRTTDTIWLGNSIWQLKKETRQFRVEEFCDLCDDWLSKLINNHPELAPCTTQSEQQLVQTSPLTHANSSYPQFFSKDNPTKQLIANREFFITFKIHTLEITPNIAHDIPGFIEIIADPRSHNVDRFYFQKTSTFTVHSFEEMEPHTMRIIDFIKEKEQKLADYNYQQETFIFLMDIAIRHCSFYYRMGCIDQAVFFATYADKFGTFIETQSQQKPLTDSQQKQLDIFKRDMSHIHWFNIYLLLYDYDSYHIPLTEELSKANAIRTAINNKKDLLQSFMNQVNDGSYWFELERLAAWQWVNRDLELAITTYLKAIKKLSDQITKEGRGSGYSRANMQLWLAVIYMEKNKYTEANELLLQTKGFYKNYAKETLNNDNINLDEAINIWKLGKLHAKLEETEKGLKFLLTSLEIFKALKLDHIKSVFVTQLQTDIQDIIGDFDKKLLKPS